MYYGGWKPYVPVAERRAKAIKKMEKLKKKGTYVQPIEGRKGNIARTFWGKAWCNHIESFHDYENRLPRGRTYVRNGSVVHLAIAKDEITAMVAGSSLYTVKIGIKPLDASRWQKFKKQCSGQIASIIDLLMGKLSDGVMAIVCDRETGLFPLSKDITLSCSCPDWASMCKHVAAVLYGVGVRLDEKPDQLFTLRGVNHEELLDVSEFAVGTPEKTKTRKLAGGSLSDVFGVDIKEKTDLKPVSTPQKVKKAITAFPKRLTGNQLRKQRTELGLTQAALAKQIGVSAASVSQWERTGRKQLRSKERVLTLLRALLCEKNG